MKIKLLGIIALLLVLCMSVCSCDALVGELIGGEPPVSDSGDNADGSDESDGGNESNGGNNSGNTENENNGNEDNSGDTGNEGNEPGGSGAVSSFDLSIVPKFSGSEYYIINNNVPFFTDKEKDTECFELYGDLDSLGRCTVAYACVCSATVPPEGDERGSISSVKPTGWIQATYSDEIGLQYLYNRSHLIGWQLTDEDANKQNLVTGTRYMNENMIPFENMVADYIKETGNRVLYRATPVYAGNNLLCSGVLLEAYSIEDEGEGLSFNVFLYNVQPQIWINYATGESRYVGEGKDLGDLGVGGNVNNETTTPDNNENNNGGNTEEGGEQVPVEPDAPVYDDTVKKTYVINKNSGKIHCADCSSVGKMSESNKLVVELTEKELQDLIGSTEGKVTYSACLTCNPDKKAVVATAATASDDED